jgi:hypothetical protein
VEALATDGRAEHDPRALEEVPCERLGVHRRGVGTREERPPPHRRRRVAPRARGTQQLAERREPVARRGHAPRGRRARGREGRSRRRELWGRGRRALQRPAPGTRPVEPGLVGSGRHAHPVGVRAGKSAIGCWSARSWAAKSQLTSPESVTWSSQSGR